MHVLSLHFLIIIDFTEITGLVLDHMDSHIRMYYLLEKKMETSFSFSLGEVFLEIVTSTK